MLRGERVYVGGTSACAADHPQAAALCAELTARRLVQQAELMVSVNAEAAHALASVLVALWVDFPAVGRLAMAHFWRTAPWLAGVAAAIAPEPDATTQGPAATPESTLVSERLVKRVRGLARLLAAASVARLRRTHATRTHPLGLRGAWQTLARQLTAAPMPRVTATILHEFLDVAGHALQHAYGRQFNKLIVYLELYLQQMRKVDSGGPLARLEELVNKIRQTGEIEPPRSRLPEGFW